MRRVAIFSAAGGQVLGRLTLCSRGGGEEAGGCTRQTQCTGGERGAAPPLVVLCTVYIAEQGDEMSLKVEFTCRGI